MNKFAYILAATASFSYVGTSEAKQNRSERQAWGGMVASEHVPDGLVHEGGNVTMTHRVETLSVEPDIARQIEVDARSSRMAG
ncbi:hypothetical protein [Ancylobacter amanitiformis]|uniref:Uncharacterized protein n=1 Tax=Ancylobacter amanitiformis TaxID=217069 RepID=A0ABU0LTP3_9HYPH|nr:hypothetical protein [Ancylobacter amanitiformis]MDQ0512074.1 hypothetical protein [Ancylobacter amanitiformis]